MHFRDKKMMKGRPRVPTGGSTKGTTVIWGDYGLRMDDFQRRISAKHLKMAEDTIKNRLRGEKYRIYKRVHCNVGVYSSGNEVWGLERPVSVAVTDKYDVESYGQREGNV
jgi:ribosomal L16p/L10e-like protein